MIRSTTLLAVMLNPLLLTAGCGSSDPVPAVDLRAATPAAFWSQYATNAEFKQAIDFSLAVGVAPCWDSSAEFARWYLLDAAGSVLTNLSPRDGSLASSIDFAPFVVTAVRCLYAAQDPAPTNHGNGLTIVAAWNPTTDESKVVYVWSSTSGARLDSQHMSTVTQRSGSRFVGLAIDRQEGRLYVADVRRFEVLRIDDLDGNGVPETLASTPAVQYPMYCADLEAAVVPSGIEFLRRPGAEGLLALTSVESLHVHPGSAGITGLKFWEDVDNDGDMDSESTWSSADAYRILGDSVYAGATSVLVDQAEGSTVRLHALAGTGSATQVGEPLASEEVTERPQWVTTSRALQAQEWVGLVDSVSNIVFKVPVAGAPRPTITSYVPDSVALGIAAVVVIKGERLRSNIVASLIGDSSSLPVPAVQWINATEIHVSVPAITDVTLANDMLSLVLNNPGATRPVALPLFVTGGP